MPTRPDRAPRPQREPQHHSVGPRRRPGADAGMATAELVVVLPAIVLALLLGVGAVGAATARMRCADAAAVAARLAARGEAREVVVDAARQVAPADAAVHVWTTSSTVHVTVTVGARILPLGGLVPPIDVTAGFAQDREPGPSP